MKTSCDSKCACSGMNLDKFIQPIILSLLKKESLTRYEAVKSIRKFSIMKENIPDSAGIYRTFALLEDHGMICTVEDGDRIAYTITEEGAQCLETWKETLNAYARSIDTLITEL